MEGTLTAYDPTQCHIFNHNDNDGPRVSVKVEKNSKGFNYEAHVQGCKDVGQAMAMLNEAVAALKSQYDAPMA